MNKSESILLLIITLVIGGILIGYVFPVGMNAMNDTDEYTEQLEKGVETNITDGVTAYVSAVNNTEGNCTILVNVTDDTTTTYTYDNFKPADSNETEDTDLGELTTSLDSVDDATHVTVTFVTEKGFGWGSAERNIYGILGIFLILSILVVVIALVMKGMK